MGWGATVWGRVARRVAQRARAEQVMQWMGSIQEFRNRIEEAQTALLHFTTLPARYDVRKLERRTRVLRRRVRDLELTVARLERCLEATRSASSDER